MMLSGLFRRRRWIVILLALGAGLAILLWQLSRARCFALVGDVTCRVETAEPMVALSLDDGPTAQGVDHVLPLLDRAGVKATFFLVGAEAEARPHLVARLHRAGHEIANHSYSHGRMLGRTRSHYREEIERTAAAFRRAGSGDNGLFRPPYGKKLVGLPLVAREAGYRLIMWDVEEPPEHGDPRAFAREVIDQARPGSILLLHVMYRGNETARRALPLILTGLRARGLRVVSVGELIAARQRAHSAR